MEFTEIRPDTWEKIIIITIILHAIATYLFRELKLPLPLIQTPMPQYTKSRKGRPSLPTTPFLNNKNKSFRNCLSTTNSIHFTPSKILLLCSSESNKKTQRLRVILPKCLRIATIEEPLREQSNTTLIWPWKNPRHPEQGENQCPQTRRPSQRMSNEDVLHHLHQMQEDISSSQNCYFMLPCHK